MMSVYELGKHTVLRSDSGPVAFGLVISGNRVSWSGHAANDLLVGRCWQGLTLYPDLKVAHEAYSSEPVKLRPDIGMEPYVALLHPVSGGGRDLLLGSREGFLHRYTCAGDYPQLTLNEGGLVQDHEQSLIFNLPYENPNHPELHNLDGYFDRGFFSYARPVAYPLDDRHVNHLIIGDWAGNLWWLPDLSGGEGPPVYRGMKYSKPVEQLTAAGRGYVERYGRDYMKPADKIADETGQPFLLGDGYDAGVAYAGGNTRPALYYNATTGAYDLLVMAGMLKQTLFYLQRTGITEQGKPIFINRGEVDLGEFYQAGQFVSIHSSVAVYRGDDGLNHLLISLGNHVAVFKNKGVSRLVPEFQFSHFIYGQDVETTGYNFTEILENRATRQRFLLDNTNIGLELREIGDKGGQPVLSSESMVIHDQDGPFRLEGETDPQGGQDWGFHRTFRWDFDGSGRQHLIVGTDKGLLYLLIEQEDLGTGGCYRFRSVGPLRDRCGEVIRIHSRACAGGIDLDGDGREDLVVGGVSYQLGVETDPTPGGGFYRLMNRGLDPNGLPILDPAEPLCIIGFDYEYKLNTHVHLHAMDVDQDGRKELILVNQTDAMRGRLFKVNPDGSGVYYMDRYVQRLSIEENLLDLDDDGELEQVFGGGEIGVAHYCKITPPIVNRKC